MQRFLSSGMVHQGGSSVVERGPVAREIGGVIIDLLVYMTQIDGLSACFPTVTMRFYVPGYYHRRK